MIAVVLLCIATAVIILILGKLVSFLWKNKKMKIQEKKFKEMIVT